MLTIVPITNCGGLPVWIGDLSLPNRANPPTFWSDPSSLSKFGVLSRLPSIRADGVG